jgi:hypothetical protein
MNPGSFLDNSEYYIAFALTKMMSASMKRKAQRQALGF